MSGVPPTVEEMRLAMLLMFALLLILACLAIEPIDWKPKVLPVEFCKLHARPLAECLDQHNEDDPSVDHEPTTLD